MIHDVDESLRALIRRDALAGTDVEVLARRPDQGVVGTSQLAHPRHVPVRHPRGPAPAGERPDRRATTTPGRVTARRRPPRYYKLSYLVTAWTQRPEDEHRLLSAVLALLAPPRLPAGDVLAGRLAGDQAARSR